MWDILFSGYHLVETWKLREILFSMIAMMVGLSMVATMAQAQQAHIVRWGFYWHRPFSFA
jgi:hypothetical protein